MAGERKLDQGGDELLVGDAGGLPEFGIHGDACEARQGVDLVHVGGIARDEEVHASEPCTADGHEGLAGKEPNFLTQVFADPGRDDEFGGVIHVLGVEVVEFAAGDDLSRDGSLGVVIAEYGHLDLEGIFHCLFHENFVRESEGEGDALLYLCGAGGFGDADAGAQGRRLDEERFSEGVTDLLQDLFPVMVPHPARNAGAFHNGDALLGEDPLGHILVHGDGGRHGGAANIGDESHLEHPLQRPVFAAGAVQDREDHADGGDLAVVEAQEALLIRVGREDDAPDVMLAKTPEQVERPCAEEPSAPLVNSHV